MASAYKYDPDAVVPNAGVAYRPSSVPDTYTAPNVLVNPPGEEILRTTPVHLTKAEAGAVVAMDAAEVATVQTDLANKRFQQQNAAADALQLNDGELAEILVDLGWVRRADLVAAVKARRGL